MRLRRNPISCASETAFKLGWIWGWIGLAGGWGAFGCGEVAPPAVEIQTRDGATMRLIPAAKRLPAFYLDTTEVTFAQYRRFVEETGHAPPYDLEIGHESRPIWENPHLQDPQLPIVAVSWMDAQDYAKWAGKRLPTEAEWERAAKGGLNDPSYPWGDALPTPERANTGQGSPLGIYLYPIRTFPPNGYGLYEMAGNAAEWCADADETGQWRVLKGGGWTPSVNDVRISARYLKYPLTRDIAYGFRCALDAADAPLNGPP